jgi:mannan endo-1,4-beta-mannosidase
MRTPLRPSTAALCVALAFPALVGCPADAGDGGGDGAPGGEGEGEGEGEGDAGEGEGEGEGEGDDGEGEGEGLVPVEPRPPASRGSGFYVVGSRIFDKHGQPLVIAGFNHTHAWGDDADNRAAIAEFPRTRANVVRAVFMPGLGSDTPAERRAVVEQYLAHEIVPMVEDHRTTGSDDPGVLRAAVDDWLHPDNVAWLVEYEDRVILNIANEWMSSFDDDLWVDSYREAITRLRDAGLHHLLVVDAGGAFGQNPRSIRDRGAELLADDPERNVAFSVHMYGYWRTAEATDVGTWNDAGTQSPWSIDAELRAIRDRDLALIVGEIAWEGSGQVLYRSKPALQAIQSLGIGFLGWSWNWNSDPALDFMADGQAYTYAGPSDLSPAGRLFLTDPDVGIEQVARPSTAFLP